MIKQHERDSDRAAIFYRLQYGSVVLVEDVIKVLYQFHLQAADPLDPYEFLRRQFRNDSNVPMSRLLSVLERTTGKSHHVFIVLDRFNECPDNSIRGLFTLVNIINISQ